jgi:hypothetical protein
MTDASFAEDRLEPLDDELRALVDDTKACDADDSAYSENARERVLELVASAVREPAREARGIGLRSGVMLASVCLLATIAGSKLIAGDPLATERGTAGNVRDEVSAPVPGPVPHDESVPTMHVDDLPSSASPPPPALPPAVRSRTDLPVVTTAAASATHRDAVERDGLAEEYRLVEDARAKLAARDHRGALAVIHEYETRFPSGQLRQEGESLHIQALVETGRIDEARERAQRFRTRFPNGLLLPSVARAIASGTPDAVAR